MLPNMALILLLALGFAALTSAKRNYKLDVEGFEIVKDRKFMLQICELRVLKYNSTTNVIKGNLTVTEDDPGDIALTIEAHQLLNSNKYSMIPVGRQRFLICDVVKDKEYYPTVLAKSNFPTKCPIQKGSYVLENFIPDFKALPSELPGERWRLDAEVVSKRRLLAKLYLFVYVNRNL